MSQDEENIKSLEQRLKSVRAQVSPKEANPGKLGQGFSTMNMGMTIVFSLFGGVVLGTIIGLALDRFAGTGPWGLIVFLTLGSVAGVRTAIKMGNELASQQPLVPDSDPNTPDWDDDEEEWLHVPQAQSANKQD